MFKFVILLAIIAVATAGLAPVVTPLLGKLIPQPALAPANTEHAGVVSGLVPIARQVISYQSLYPASYPTLYSAEAVPLAYANNHVAYSAPAQASSYRISY